MFPMSSPQKVSAGHALFLLLLTLTFSQNKGEKLDEYILDYEPLSFDTHHLHNQHHRIKRSASRSLQYDFDAYGRHFALRLKPDTDIFSPDHVTEVARGQFVPVDTSFIYTGHVENEPGSFAHMALINGTLRGHIFIPGDTTYHLEAAEQYFDQPGFHAVIYPESKMDKDPFRHKRAADEVGSCGMDMVKDWMEKVARSAVEDNINRVKRSSSHRDQESEKSKYYAEIHKKGGTEKEHSRKKRATLGINNTCFLYLRSDPMMWKFVKEVKFKTTLTDERVKEEILGFFASHVSALKTIFHNTTFSTYKGDLTYSGVNFVVQRTGIMTHENQGCGTSAATRYCEPNIDVSNFLNLNSKDPHDEFCLAYVFTHRDFTRGTLGLAWVGAREVASGGICERYKTYMDTDKQTHKSLNTGIVTTVNYGKAVPPRVSQLTFTHEVGHNFGSPHDQGVDCAPFGSDLPNAKDGNYIMFASATMGDRPNNDDFSSCSKDNITRLLHVVVNELNNKKNCFKPSKTAFCGNGIKEAGEECDCGYDNECEDSCCHGRNAENGKECTLRDHAKCSPTAGPCCNSSCQFVAQSLQIQCLPADDCKESSYCDGTMAECPPPVLEPNGTSCNDDAQLCSKGECVLSVCKRIGWEECFLTSEKGDSGPSKEALCYVSCLNPRTQKCVSSYDKAAVEKPENEALRLLLLNITKKRAGKNAVVIPKGIQLPAGSPCDNFRGYCDVMHKCRGVDADGPLARLKNLIFNPETLENIQQWIVRHWWAVLLMAIALILVMGAFIKVCAVHTPSSNPRKPKARELTLPRTLRRRPRPRPQQPSGQGSSSQQQSQSQQAGSSSANHGGGGGSGRSGGRGRGGGGGGGGGANKPENNEAALLAQEPPPPYSTVVSPLTSVEIVNAPSSSSSPAAPMIEPVGAPDLSAIPPGGPKRGRGGARGQAGAAGKAGKGAKKKQKGNMEMHKL